MVHFSYDGTMAQLEYLSKDFIDQFDYNVEIDPDC